MTTIIPFIPSNIVTPSCSVNLDGDAHDIKITWNVSAQRFYINIYRKTDEAWIITEPLISSPPGHDVNSVEYDPFNAIVLISLVRGDYWGTPIGGPSIKPGTKIDYTLSGFQPATYNGKFRAMHIDDIVFSIPMPRDPGPLVIAGQVNRYLDMAQPVFKRSTLIYRNGAFEVNP